MIMRNVNITYADAVTKKALLSIEKVKAENDYIVIEASSDERVLELYINDKLCCRQKNKGYFVFEEPLPEGFCDCTQIKVACKEKPDISCIISVGLVTA